MNIKRYLRRLRSRTIRFAVVWLPALAAGLAVLEANLGLLQEHLGPYQYLALAAIVAVAQVRLRAVTSKPLEKYDDAA